MSSVTTSPGPASPSVPSAIRDRLRHLRSRITQFILVDGLSRLVGALIAIVLLDLVIDRLFKMDQAQRLVLLCVMASVVAVIMVWRVIRPLMRRVGDDALILQVEDHNRQLGESLISTIQFARDRQQWDQRGYSEAFVDATIQQGSRWAEKIDFGSTINGRAFAQNLILLLAGGLTMVGMAWGIMSTDLGQTWFRRNILLTNDQWPRNTRLAIVGVVDGRLELPRGEDHKQFVEVGENSRIRDVEVTIEFDDDNSRTRQKMRPTGLLSGRQHLLVFRNIAHPFRFRAIGGDDTTDWVDVSLVDPPAWDQLELIVLPPQYTGVARETLPPGGGPYSILAGSFLEIQATANKPLGEAALVSGDRRWSLPGEQDRFGLLIPADDLVGGKYTFDLADPSGMRSSRPASFTVKIKPDRPPQVRANLLGISGLVVPRARIPVSWTASDEYAIMRAEFVFDWSVDSPESVPKSGAIDLATLGGDTGALIGMSEIRAVDVLDLEPLAIPTGVGLNLAVRAADNNTLTGPGVGTSRGFLLRVVTEDELRSDLLRREIEQRKAFELVLKNQEELQVDVRALADTAKNDGIAAETAATNMLAWQRRQKLVGTNIATIANRFEEFLVEVKNNRLDEAENEIDASRSIEVRFNDRIIEPIRQLDQSTIIEAVQLLDQSQRLITNATDFAKSLDETADKQEVIIETMREILSAMQDSETYQEVVNLAIEVKRRQESVRELTREQKDKADIRNIFDDAPVEKKDDTTDDGDEGNG